MAGPQFAIHAIRGGARSELATAMSLASLGEKAASMDARGADRYAVVHYRRAGKSEIASAETIDELERKMMRKIGGP